MLATRVSRGDSSAPTAVNGVSVSIFCSLLLATGGVLLFAIGHWRRFPGRKRKEKHASVSRTRRWRCLAWNLSRISRSCACCNAFCRSRSSFFSCSAFLFTAEPPTPPPPQPPPPLPPPPPGLRSPRSALDCFALLDFLRALRASRSARAASRSRSDASTPSISCSSSDESASCSSSSSPSPDFLLSFFSFFGLPLCTRCVPGQRLEWGSWQEAHQLVWVSLQAATFEGYEFGMMPSHNIVG